MIKKYKVIFRVTLLVASLLMSSFLFISNTVSANTGDMAKHMSEFYKNPKATMQKAPEKFNIYGHRVTGNSKLFSLLDVATKNYINIKVNAKRGCSPSNSVSILPGYFGFKPNVRASIPLFAEIDRHNNTQRFLNTNSYIKNLKKMDVNNLLSAQLSEMPWSGDYWAVANGILGARNFDNEFTIQQDWLSIRF